MSVGMVILAGGVGKRMHQKTPKQFLLLGGKPIIIHVLENIEKVDEIEKVVICSPKEHIEQMKQLIFNHNIQKNIICVEGGKTRQESTYIGAKNLKGCDSIIVHEAVRPFVSDKEFKSMINSNEENAIYGIDIPFTVLEGNEYIEKNLERNKLINVQLPQKFNGEKLLAAHEQAAKEEKHFTEDASLFYHYYPGDKIKIMEGSLYNIKITTPVDLISCEQIYKEYIVGRK